MAIITLPISAVKEMSKEYIKIEIPESELLQRKINLAIIQAACGILKDLNLDALEYQQQIRSEWNGR